MIVSGFSGNEMFCLAEKGWAAGSIVIGNSVQSLGFVGGIASGLRTIAGGEIENLTQLITEGRHAAIERLEKEALSHGAHGVTGVTSDLRNLSGLREFIAIGSTIKGKDYVGPFFTTACSGQDLYCQVDAGYDPRHFVMGNVAYALGVSRGFFGFLRGFAGGEVKEFSDMYNHTRHLALERLENEARERGANAVVDIHTHIIPLGAGAREMLMVGTASHQPAFGDLETPVTSELTGEELWNLARLGYAPMRLLLGTSVYSLGLARGIGAFFQGLGRGEVDGVTQLIYEARANCLEHIEKEAKAIGADLVIGIKVHIYEIGSSFVEVMAIGTAIKKMPGISTQTPILIPQAIIRDRDTFFDKTHEEETKLER
ncbi:MAG: heavy metal-binding domain-containing protein [Planctomycetes bacterium]|nr:heavy metal-binding domain-containing protein [Planctomycetota bacterium]